MSMTQHMNNCLVVVKGASTQVYYLYILPENFVTNNLILPWAFSQYIALEEVQK